MTNTNVQQNLYSILEQMVKFNEPANICTKDGNVVLMSEDDYKNVMANFEMYGNPVFYEKIIKGLNTPLSDCLFGDEVQW